MHDNSNYIKILVIQSAHLYDSRKHVIILLFILILILITCDSHSTQEHSMLDFVIGWQGEGAKGRVRDTD